MPLANHPNVLGGGSPGAGVELSGGTSLVTKGVLYADSGNTVTTEAAFIYTATTNTLTVDNVVSNAATALSLSANGNVTINTTNGSTLAATLSGANTALAGNLTVSGTGTSSFAGILSQAQTGSDNNLSLSSTGQYTTINLQHSGVTQAQVYWDNSGNNLNLSANSFIRGTLNVTGAGTSSFAGDVNIASASGQSYNVTISGGPTVNYGASGSGYIGTFSAHSFNIYAGSSIAATFAPTTLNTTFASTTSGTSTTAAAILGKSMGLTENLFVGGTVNVAGGAVAALVSVATLTSGAGASVGTLTNAPSAGNPTTWFKIVDNGVTRYVPAW